MNQESKTLLLKIEELVVKRDVLRAKRAISALLVREKHQAEARVLASEFYRRLSDFRSALRVLDSEKEDHPRLRFQLARILNLLGASTYAMRILSQFKLSDLSSVRTQAVGIFLSNYQYSQALTLLENLKLTPTSSYAERMELISKADALQGLGRTAEALQMVDALLDASPENLIRAILYQVKGAYLLLDGDVNGAGDALLTSERFFSATDQTADRGYLEKWLGAYYIFKKDEKKALEYLDRAWKILYKPGTRPESWLEVLYWYGRLSLLKNTFPEEWVRINAYPQSPNNRVLRWIRTEVLHPHAIIYGEEKYLFEERLHHLDLESHIRKRKSHFQFGLNLSEELIAQLLIAGEYGVPLFRLAETLWADELFSFKGNMKRLEQLVMRARREEKFKMDWEDLHLYSRGNRNWSAFWAEEKKPKGWAFLALYEGKDQTFSRAEVEKYFKLSPRRALQVCEEWKATGLIEQQGLTKSARYKCQSAATKIIE